MTPDRDEPRMSPTYSAVFEMLDVFKKFGDGLEADVAVLRGNGFTDDQARAIVAHMFGWRPTNGQPPEGREGL